MTEELISLVMPVALMEQYGEFELQLRAQAHVAHV